MLMMVVVSFKYVMLVLRADNRGEGGTLALLELCAAGKGRALGADRAGHLRRRVVLWR